MARNWKQVRDEAVNAGLLDEQQVVNARKEMQGEIRAHKLADVRKSLAVRQVDLAERMNVAQSRVSAIEHNSLTKTELGTVQAYVESLGGKLRIVADFGDETITVQD